jgi:hypothetical protein
MRYLPIFRPENNAAPDGAMMQQHLRDRPDVPAVTATAKSRANVPGPSAEACCRSQASLSRYGARSAQCRRSDYSATKDELIFTVQSV